MKQSFLLLVFVCGCFASCQMQTPYMTISGFTQGTTYNITYQGDTLYTDQINAYLEDFDRSLSFYNDSSLLSMINRGETNSIDPLFEQTLQRTFSINSLCDGFFDPTVGSLFRAYGFIGGGSPKMLSQAQIDSVMIGVGLSKVAIVDGVFERENDMVTLDFSGIAQGFSADMIAKLLKDNGVRNFMVEIGGEILAGGISPSGNLWRIGIDTPEQGNMVSGAHINTIIEIGGEGIEHGVATSGNYRKFLETEAHEIITHTLDPRTGQPVVRNLLSATILSESAAFADGFATAAMVGGFDWTRQRVDSLRSVGYDIDCVLIYSDSLSVMRTYSTLH